MPVIWMIVTRQRHPTMKSTTCLTLKWRLLARVARPCLSSASHFLGLRISPSCSDIFRRLRISLRNCGTDKFFGRLGKIDCFFISTPWCLTAYILSNFGIFCLYFEHISVNAFHPMHAPKLLGGEWVGVQYSGNHKPLPIAQFTSSPSSGQVANHPHTG